MLNKCQKYWVLLVKNTRLTTTPPSLLHVSVQSVPVCTFQTSPCMPAPRAHVETHVRVVPVFTGTFLNVHTEAFWTDTRVFSACRTPHTPHTTHHTAPQNTTQHNMTHHKRRRKRRRQNKTKREDKKRQDKTKKGRQDETRQDKTKREERRDERRETRDKRQDERDERDKRR